MTTLQLAFSAPPAATAAPAPLATIAAWRRRRQLRAELRRLLATAPYLLDDIGLSETAARTEAAKPFWVG
jgi:uncharacterized protein YjiS (DUF1127 family)